MLPYHSHLVPGSPHPPVHHLMSHPTSLPSVSYTWPVGITNALAIVAWPCPQPSTATSLETHHKFPFLHNGLIFIIHSLVRGGAWRRKDRKFTSKPKYNQEQPRGLGTKRPICRWVNRNVILTLAQLLFCDPSKGLWLFRSWNTAAFKKTRICHTRDTSDSVVPTYYCTCYIPELCSYVYNDLST
jgi:hypothetical protein